VRALGTRRACRAKGVLCTALATNLHRIQQQRKEVPRQHDAHLALISLRYRHRLSAGAPAPSHVIGCRRIAGRVWKCKHRDLSSCCAALQQLWGTRSCGKTDRISELEPINNLSVGGPAPSHVIGCRCPALQNWRAQAPRCFEILCGPAAALGHPQLRQTCSVVIMQHSRVRHAGGAARARRGSGDGRKCGLNSAQ
jgi:hypothetical protein